MNTYTRWIMARASESFRFWPMTQFDLWFAGKRPAPDWVAVNALGFVETVTVFVVRDAGEIVEGHLDDFSKWRLLDNRYIDREHVRDAMHVAVGMAFRDLKLPHRAGVPDTPITDKRFLERKQQNQHRWKATEAELTELRALAEQRRGGKSKRR